MTQRKVSLPTENLARSAPVFGPLSTQSKVSKGQGIDSSETLDSRITEILSKVQMVLCKMSERESGEPDRRYLSLKNAGIYCDLSQKTLRRFISLGELKAYRPARGKILIKRQELDALIEQSTRNPRKGRGFRN